MACRMIDDTLLEDGWFQDLSAPNQHLWLLMLIRSSMGGFVTSSKRYWELFVGDKFDWDSALSAYGDKIHKCGGKFWIPDAVFLRINADSLNENNHAHLGVIKDLKRNQMWDRFLDLFPTLEVVGHTQPPKGQARVKLGSREGLEEEEEEINSLSKEGGSGGKERHSLKLDTTTTLTDAQEGTQLSPGTRISDWTSDESTGWRQASFEAVGDLRFPPFPEKGIPLLERWVKHFIRHSTIGGKSFDPLYLQSSVARWTLIDPEILPHGVKLCLDEDYKTVSEALCQLAYEKVQVAKATGRII